MNLLLTKSGNARCDEKNCLTLDRCLVEAAEVMHDVLLALARRRVNPRSGEEVFAPRGKVLVRPNPSALEKILNREFLPSSCDLGLPLIGFIRATETLKKDLKQSIRDWN